jgi:hypothetical protein
VRFGWASLRFAGALAGGLGSAIRTVVARERRGLLATREPKGWLGRLGVVASDCKARVRGGLPVITGQLLAVDRGRGCDVRFGW